MNNRCYFFALLIVCSLSGLPLFSQGVAPVLADNQQISLSSDASLLGDLGEFLVFYRGERAGNPELWLAGVTGTVLVSAEAQEQLELVDRSEESWIFRERRAGRHFISELGAGSRQLDTLLGSNEAIRTVTRWRDNIYYVRESSRGGGIEELVRRIEGSSEVLFTSTAGGIPGLGFIDEALIFIAHTVEGQMLVRSDGTAGGTVPYFMLYDVNGESAEMVFLESSGNSLYLFYHPDNDPYGLWYTDGTFERTRFLQEYQFPFYGLSPNSMLFFEDKFFFSMQEVGTLPSRDRVTLHVSDGTADGTLNLNDGIRGLTRPRDLLVFEDKVFFVVRDLNWSVKYSDGTQEGTGTLIEPFGHQNGGLGCGARLGLYDDRLVLQARRADTGHEIFISDGTPESITLLADVVPGPEDSNPENFVQVADRLYFIATIGGERQLWFYDPNLVTNIKKVIPGPDYRVFPNPTSGEFVFELHPAMSAQGQGMQITIFNSAGIPVLSTPLSGHRITLESGGWPPGVYFYRLTREAGDPIAVGRLLKK